MTTLSHTSINFSIYVFPSKAPVAGAMPRLDIADTHSYSPIAVGDDLITEGLPGVWPVG